MRKHGANRHGFCGSPNPTHNGIARNSVTPNFLCVIRMFVQKTRKLHRIMKCRKGFTVKRNTVLTVPNGHIHEEDYRELDSHGKKIVNTVCSLEKERIDLAAKPKKRNNVIQLADTGRERYIPRYTTPSAAGTSVPLDGADFEMILVDSSVPDEADYAVNIQGNSMFPYIHDGDMVYVKKDAEMSIGDVGIFCVDGAMYCKQYYVDENGNLELVSANPELRNTNVFVSSDSGSSVKCYGKVLMGFKLELPDYLFEE